MSGECALLSCVQEGASYQILAFHLDNGPLRAGDAVTTSALVGARGARGRPLVRGGGHGGSLRWLGTCGAALAGNDSFHVHCDIQRVVRGGRELLPARLQVACHVGAWAQTRGGDGLKLSCSFSDHPHFTQALRDRVDADEYKRLLKVKLGPSRRRRQLPLFETAANAC